MTRSVTLSMPEVKSIHVVPDAVPVPVDQDPVARQLVYGAIPVVSLVRVHPDDVEHAILVAFRASVVHVKREKPQVTGHRCVREFLSCLVDREDDVGGAGLGALEITERPLLGPVRSPG